MVKQLLLFLLVVKLSSVCFGQVNPENAVRESFNNYIKAMQNDNGEDALRFLDTRSISYFDAISKYTRSADSITVSSLPIMDKSMVLILRNRATKDEIRAFNGKSLLIYAINNGMCGKTQGGSVGDVSIDRDFAKGQLLINGQAAPFFLHFYLEEGQWKMDLTSLFELTSTYMKKMVEELGGNENAVCTMFARGGVESNKNIWQPVE